MNILLSNDDGVQAEGLQSLYRKLSGIHRVAVVAPDRERTAVSHAITLEMPIRADEISLNGDARAYAVSGTPADCIKLALTRLLGEKPDLVISGINPGANVGVNINYSGTFAAAREAALYGIPAFAVSINAKKPAHYQDAADFVDSLVERNIAADLPQGTLLNINFPDLPRERIKGVRISRQNMDQLDEFIERRIDPRDRAYYWHGLNSQNTAGDPELDTVAVSQAYVSITPVKCDMTDYQSYDVLKEWNIRW